MAIQTIATKFDAARLFVPDVYEDDRGFFKETYSTAKYRAVGLEDEFVQDSVSFSSLNVLRGLHRDSRMAKLVQVLRGRVWDVIVDLRPGSPTFAQHQGFYLSEHNHQQLYVPAGFANGFLTLTPDVVFSYKHSALYDAARESAIRWDDPQLAVEWPLASEPRISAKDRANGSLSDFLASGR